ncbi:hypothetical protein BGZ98_000562, partial [Dissophora globulifera]
MASAEGDDTSRLDTVDTPLASATLSKSTRLSAAHGRVTATGADEDDCVGHADAYAYAAHDSKTGHALNATDRSPYLNSLDSNSFGLSQLLDHPHIIYPSILQTHSPQDCDNEITAAIHSKDNSNIATAVAMAGSRSISPSRSSSTFDLPTWGTARDRLQVRDCGSGPDSGNGSDVTDVEIESSDSETEQMRRKPELHHSRPVSMKRRKVSEEEDEEDSSNSIGGGEDFSRRYDSSTASLSSSSSSTATESNLARGSALLPATLSSSSSSLAWDSPQPPSSWTARKRRSILADPLLSSSLASTLSLSNIGDGDVANSMDVSSGSNNDSLDTSSLSLLSTTSALVSAGAMHDLNSNEDDTGNNHSNIGSTQPSLILSSLSSTSSPSPPSSSESSPIESKFSSILHSSVSNSQQLSFFTSSSPKSSSPSSSPLSWPCSRRFRYYYYCSPLLSNACRKRTFEDAIELTRPLGNEPSIEHAGWLGSIKRRKIHHFPTRWTSTLSPSPYIKLMAMRDFWDVMRSRLDLSWLDLWAISASGWSWEKQKPRLMPCSATEVKCGETRELAVPEESDAAARVLKSDSLTSTPIRESTITTTTRIVDSGARKITQDVLRRNIKTDLLDDSVSPTRLLSASTLSSSRGRTVVVQHPNTGLFLRGLWEEEEKTRRQQQMIPECVHKPLRSKILNRKPIPRANPTLNDVNGTTSRKYSWIQPEVTSEPSLSPSSRDPENESQAIEGSNESQNAATVSAGTVSSDLDPGVTHQPNHGPSQTEQQEQMLRRKHGPAASAVRSNALSEGYDLNEYKPWKDGTITPHRGSIRTLCQLRSTTTLDPWPLEESLAKDECTRILHRMREQLNVVINLQIHLRSMMKASPSHMSFLLSIRHPGQVSVELLNALYGPQFMQTSAFRSIEQLLWGSKYQSPRMVEYSDQPPSYSNNCDDNCSNHNSSKAGKHQYQQHQSQPTLPSPSYSYEQRETFESVVDARMQGTQHHQQQEQQQEASSSHQHYRHYTSHQPPHQQQRYSQQYHRECDIMEDDEGCEFEEEFEHSSYQGPMMLEMDHRLVLDIVDSSPRKGLDGHDDSE